MERSFKKEVQALKLCDGEPRGGRPGSDQGPAGSVARFREPGVEGVEPVDRTSMLRLPTVCRKSRRPAVAAARRPVAPAAASSNAYGGTATGRALGWWSPCALPASGQPPVELRRLSFKRVPAAGSRNEGVPPMFAMGLG